MSGGLIAAVVIAAVLLLIISIRFSAEIKYDGEELHVYAGGRFIRILVYPRKKRVKNKKAEKIKKREHEKAKKKKEKPSFRDILNASGDLGPVARRALKHLRINKLDADIVASGGDAASAAVTYGGICAAVGAAHPVLDSLVDLKDYSIGVYIDYDAKKTAARADIKISISIIAAAVAAAGVVKALVKLKE